MDLFYYILAGAFVGFAVGLTGVGGGSLMTPILVKLFGFPMNIAVGTDLLYAAITKSGGVAVHRRQRTIRWDIVAAMSAGSLPAALATALVLQFVFTDPEQYNDILATSLGIMLIITSASILFKNRIANFTANSEESGAIKAMRQNPKLWVFIMGVILGVFVTLSSVGAGAFGTAILFLLFPQLPSIKIIGTDLAHAVPLTLFAGLFHWYFLGNVNFTLLGGLLIGSLPAVYLGTRLSYKMPNQVLQPVLASALLAIGVKYAFF